MISPTTAEHIPQTLLLAGNDCYLELFLEGVPNHCKPWYFNTKHDTFYLFATNPTLSLASLINYYDLSVIIAKLLAQRHSVWKE